MSSARVVAKFAAAVTNYSRIGFGGGHGELTRCELSGLMSGLPDECVALLLCKYADCKDLEGVLYDHVVAKAMLVASELGVFDGDSGVVVSELAGIALYQVLYPARGKDGATKRMSGRDIAVVIGIDESSYRRRWRVVYDYVFKFVQGIESIAITRLSMYFEDTNRI